MPLVDDAKSKLAGALAEVQKLKASEFPHNDSRDALENIEGVFHELTGNLNDLAEDSDEQLIKAECAEVNKQLARNLPLLGHILRSTNIRNAFEFHGPVLQIAQKLLGEDVKLILSSEWEFSPFSYPPIYSHLIDFVFIGFPASESSNSLIIPLVGHELGHLVWQKKKYKDQLSLEVRNAIINGIKKRWQDFKIIFLGTVGDVNQDNLMTDLVLIPIWGTSYRWALRQCEEVFCDFLGLMIFGVSYLFAFEYILSPYLGESRSPRYPSIIDRVRYLSKAASRFGIEVPVGYSENFSNEPEELKRHEKYLATVSDNAVATILDRLMVLAEGAVAEAGLYLPKTDAADRVYKAFEMLVPACDIGNLGELVNGGWKARLDQNLWYNNKAVWHRREQVINDLLLKSIEVMEVEGLMDGDRCP